MTRALTLALIILLDAGSSLASIPPAVIQTVAGGGSPEDVPAVSANVVPSAIKFGPDGLLYLADGWHNRVYRIDSAGTLRVVAGTGVIGFSGDGGPATEAMINRPEGLAFDGTGSLFIAGGQRVRKVDASTGVITTIAGDGDFGTSGDGGLATAAKFRRPTDLVFDADGDLFILDEDALRVRRVDTQTGIIFAYAGGGSITADGWRATETYFLNPAALAFDPGGNLLVAQSHSVRRIDRSTRIVSTIAGSTQFGFGGDGGPAVSSLLKVPTGLALDGSGNLLIADEGNNRVRMVNRLTGVISTVAGSGVGTFSGDGGPALAAGLDPWGVAVAANGDWIVLDRTNFRVRKVDAATGTISTIAGDGTCCFFGEGIPALRSELALPEDVAVDGSGNIFLMDAGNARVRRVDHRTGVITTVFGNGIQADSGDGGPATSASLHTGGIAVDGLGNLFLASKKIRRVDAATGIVQTVAGNGTGAFNGDGIQATAAGMIAVTVAMGPGGDIYLLDRANVRVRRVDAGTGVIDTVAGNGSFSLGQDGQRAVDTGLFFPADIAVDRAGNLLISESGFHDEMNPYGSNRIRRVDAITGILTTVAGTGAFHSGPNGIPATSSSVFLPGGLAVDVEGNFYFAEGFDFETGTYLGGVRGVTASTGIIDSVVGWNYLIGCGFGGDGGLAIDSTICSPGGLATDASGNLFVADINNQRIRRVRLGNSPPIARAGADLTIGCDSQAGAHVTLDGSGSDDLDSMPGTNDDIASWEWFEQVGSSGDVLLGSGRMLEVDLSAGTHSITLRVTDLWGAVSTDTQQVTVVPGPPAGLSVSFSPPVLWPPNHRMVPVDVALDTSGSCGLSTSYTLLSVTSSEPDDAPGGSDGNTSGDIQDASPGTADMSFSLRAERDSQGSGRLYDVAYLASNAAGETTVSASLFVPHDKGGVTDPVNLSALQAPAGTLLQWTEVPGAHFYNVIRGELAGLKVIGSGVDIRVAQCLASHIQATDTAGLEDAETPLPGQILFYLVEYDDGTPSGYGSAEVEKPLLEPKGICQ